MVFIKKGIVCQDRANDNYGIKEHDKLSEQRSEFGFKTSTTNDVAYEKATPVNKLQFVRQSFNRANQLMPSSIRTNSTYRTDFSRKSLIPNHPVSYDAFCDRISQRAVNRCAYAHQPGYQKYLDIYAPLNYPLHTNDQLRNGISKIDNITVWDWLQVPKTKGTTVHIELPPDKCIDRVQNCVIRPYAKNNFVPNRGLWTEHQEHYRLQ